MGTRPAELRDVHQGGAPSRLRLLAPLRYLRIAHPEKATYDVVLPLALASSIWVAYSVFSPPVPIFGDAGVLKYARDLLIMAVPFTIGALAAVSMGTPGKSLDRRPPGAELLLDGDLLTLRQFVCFLLGYLSFLGLTTLLGSVIAQLLHDAVKGALTQYPHVMYLCRSCGILSLCILCTSLTTTVFWALYFLTEVVNQEPPEAG